MATSKSGDRVRAIGVIGLGYVGLPLALSFAEAGHPVVAFDRDSGLVSFLLSGCSHIGDVPDERLSAALASELQVTAEAGDLASCSTFIICVPTPLSRAGDPDTRYIASAVESIAPYVRAGSLVVLESTSYPGTTEEIVAGPLAALTALTPGSDFCVAFSPERVDPGNPEFDLRNTPKVVAGLAPCCSDRAVGLYSGVSGSVVRGSGLREAELAKLLENTYRQVNIALMNEMAKFCRALDIDIYEAIRLASTKPFGFQPFYPGPGVGGHCIPIDPKYLASRVQSELGYAFRFVELAQEINDGMPAYVVRRLASELARRSVDLSSASVLLLGVTYKANVADMRESPAEEIARLLRAEGAEVTYHDPYVPAWAVDGLPIASQSERRHDAVILLQAHDAFEGLDFSALAPLCLDTRGVLSGPNIVRL